MSIAMENLTKRFGKKTAVEGITLDIKQGMYGLLGPNGAGKTTLMRMLATLITPSDGQARLDDVPIKQKKQVRRIIGYLPQDFSFYPSFTVRETLDYLAMLSNINNAAQRAERVKEVLALTNLSANAGMRVSKLSGGMRRRLGIAQVLLSDPSVIIVDEPTAGLDPEERIRFRNLLGMVAAQEKTVLLSTHIAEDISQTCANVAVLNEGKLLYAGGVTQLIEKAQGRVWRTFAQPDVLLQLRQRHMVVAMVPQGDGYDVRLVADQKPNDAAQSVTPGLEDAYMLLLKGGERHAPNKV